MKMLIQKLEFNIIIRIVLILISIFFISLVSIIQISDLITDDYKSYNITPTGAASHAPIVLNGNAEVDAFFAGNVTEDGLSWQTAYTIDSYDFDDQGYNYYNDILLIDTSRYIKITNCNFHYSTSKEIQLDNVTHVNISNCDITADITGIEITDSNDVIIQNVTCNGLYTTFESYGINVKYSENCSIIKNVIYNFKYGISCYPSSLNCTIKDNEVTHSERDNIKISGFNNKIFNNTCLYSDLYFGMFISGSNNSLENNTCNYNGRFNNGEGIRLQGENNSLIGNDCSWNDKGILINGFNNSLIRNNFTYNQGYGIDLFGGSNCTFLENFIAFNGKGLYINNNILNLTCLENVFIENGINFYISLNTKNNFLTFKMDETNKINSKPLYFGKNQNDIIISGDYGQYIVVNCNRTKISNFNATIVENGISLIGCDNSTISNSTMNSKLYGLTLVCSSNCTISGNSFVGLNYQYSYAMYLYYSQNLKIDNNFIQGYDNGLFGYNVENSSIYNNNFTENMDNGLRLLNSDYCNISRNSFYINELNDIRLWSINYCKISDNSFIKSGNISLILENSYMIIIDNNTFGENKSFNDCYGIFIEDYSSCLSIYNNSFLKLKIGIFMGSFNNNHTIRSNIFYDCRDYGIQLNSSLSVENITIYENFFFYTGAYDNSQGTNWDNGSVGNYWYDYYGEDINGDGIGDIPYYLIDGSSNSQDNYPIVIIIENINESTQENETTNPFNNNTQTKGNNILEGFIQFGVPVITGALAGLVMVIIFSKKKAIKG